MIIHSDQATGTCDVCDIHAADCAAVAQGATGRYCEVMWLCTRCAAKWAGGEDKILTAQAAREICEKDPIGYPDFERLLMNRTLTHLLADGWTLKVGRHTRGMSGFYADLYKPECVSEDDDGCEYICDRCGNYEQTVTWDQAGHGFTPKEAIQNAIDILSEVDCAPESAIFCM